MKKKQLSSETMEIRTIDQIDLDSHAVIEASAGTGKTHTIEHLVVSILETRKVRSLDEILVVTFTEKAASDLKERIRANIRASYEDRPSEILRSSLDGFDTASIFTIHGFCNRLLQEYAFENDERFQHQLVDDRSLYRKILPAIQRDLWTARYGQNLHEILRLSGYPSLTPGGESEWENRVIEIALRYQPLGNDILYPSGENDISMTIESILTESRACLDELLPLIGPINESDPTQSDLCTRYESLNIRKNSMKKRIRILTSVLNLAETHRSRPLSVMDIAGFLLSLETGDTGFHELSTGWNKNSPDYEEKLPYLPHIIELLERLRSLDLSALEQSLAAATINDLINYSARYKRDEGLLSYNDMIASLYMALGHDSGPLKTTLQKRYRYALVDEFQDTDMLQWKIFRTLFLETSGNRLFIIGDPKQSIYGFRGADVKAYYIARDEMTALHGAKQYNLTDNWRSSRELIRLYNTIFRDGNWFTDDNIRYLPNHYPDAQPPGSHLDIEPLCVIDCGSCSGTEAKFRTAEAIAREISSLMVCGIGISLHEIAILVTKWREAETVEKYLKRSGIRYSFYKKEGLYQTREALELAYLLQSLAWPNDTIARKRAMLTRFFRVPVRLLNRYEDLPPDHPIPSIYRRFLGLVAEKKWSLLFQAIIDETGILFHGDMDDHDRVLLNIRTIIQDLEVEAFRSHHSIREIAEHLDRLRYQAASAHETHNIQKIDMEQPGVQIMTIHASKGLQFRFVFIAGGFTQKDSSTFWTYHEDSNRIFDLVRDPDRKELHTLEMNSEQQRLFYVALTRARDRLYLPMFNPTTRTQSTSGILGDLIPRSLKDLKNDRHVRWISTDEAAPLSNEFWRGPYRVPTDVVVPNPLFPDPDMRFQHRKIEILSFTGLKSKLLSARGHDSRRIDYGEDVRHTAEDDVGFTITAPAPLHQGGLPHSRETGLMLHQILEYIDFKEVRMAKNPEEFVLFNPASVRIIDEAIRTHFPSDRSTDAGLFRDEAARIVWNTLHTPLSMANLRLCEIKKMTREAEFHTRSLPLKTGLPLDRAGIDGFLHGFIDMIFEFEDRFYIVDWKSNYIEGGYDPRRLASNIAEMHYDLQISIYGSALISWIKSFLPDYDYERHFGGIFFLYLRGMTLERPGTGVFFHRPDAESAFTDKFFSIPVT